MSLKYHMLAAVVLNRDALVYGRQRFHRYTDKGCLVPPIPRIESRTPAPKACELPLARDALGAFQGAPKALTHTFAGQGIARREFMKAGFAAVRGVTPGPPANIPATIHQPCDGAL